MRTIVYLDEDGPTSAEMLLDIDVIGLPITIAQVLLCVWHDVKPGTFAPHLNLVGRDEFWYKWASANTANYVELWNYGSDIIDEHYHRFGCRSRTETDKFGKEVVLNATGYRHGMDRSMIALQSIPPLPEADAPDPFPTSVEDARALYKSNKAPFTYTHREVPEWLK
jgi:hypothetical protein